MTDHVEVCLTLHDANAKAFKVSADGHEARAFWLSKRHATRGVACGGFHRLGRGGALSLLTIYEFSVEREKAREVGLAA